MILSRRIKILFPAKTSQCAVCAVPPLSCSPTTHWPSTPQRMPSSWRADHTTRKCALSIFTRFILVLSFKFIRFFQLLKSKSLTKKINLLWKIQLNKDQDPNGDTQATRSAGIAAVWVARNRFALLDKNQQVWFWKFLSFKIFFHRGR